MMKYMGIATDHKRIASVVVESHNKRKSGKHKRNIDQTRSHLNYHSKRTQDLTVWEQNKFLMTKYEDYLNSPKCKKSKNEKEELITKNKQFAKQKPHTFVFQIGGEYEFTDKHRGENGNNFNEYYKDVFSDQEKKAILIEFGSEFIKWVDDYSNEFKTTVKANHTVADFSVHMDERSPHLHLCILASSKATHKLTNGNFENAYFNKHMNDFGKKRLIELTHAFATQKMQNNELNEQQREKLQELSEIVAKNEIKERKRSIVIDSDTYEELNSEVKTLKEENVLLIDENKELRQSINEMHNLQYIQADNYLKFVSELVTKEQLGIPEATRLLNNIGFTKQPNSTWKFESFDEFGAEFPKNIQELTKIIFELTIGEEREKLLNSLGQVIEPKLLSAKDHFDIYKPKIDNSNIGME